MAECSPDGRFRFVKEATGPPTAGTAYDTVNGLLVGWNVLDCRKMSQQEREAARQSIDVLQGLNHSHVLGVHSSWDVPNGGPEQRRRLPWQVGGGRGAESGSGGAVSEARGGGGVNLVYMTAPCTTLDSFLENKVEFLRWRVVKRWCRQLLDALFYLHRQPTPIVHKTLNLGNVYIEPSKGHLFVGGVEDIVVLPSSSSSSLSSSSSSASIKTCRPTPPMKSVGSSGSGSGGSWSGRAWGLMAGGGGGGAKAPAAAGSGSGSGGVGGGRLGEKAKFAGAKDVRSFGTLLVEIILKNRLDPSLASAKQWVEMLLAVSGWPPSVVDFIELCIAPVDERPTADQLLEHPFLELGNALDDEPIDSNVNLVTTASAMVAAATGMTPSLSLPAAHLQHRQGSPPPPLFAPSMARCPESAGSSASTTSSAGASLRNNLAGGAVNQCAFGATATAATGGAFGANASQHPSSCPGCRGAGSQTTCSWSPGYTPSCVSTESPSPSSPSTAPSFGGVPTIPSPLPTGELPPIGPDLGWAGAMAEGQYFGSAMVDANGGVGGGVEYAVPPGVTPTAFANAIAMASQINAMNCLASGTGGDDFRNSAENPIHGRIRAVSLTTLGSSGARPGAAEARTSNGGGDGVSGEGGAPTTRTRSASEDAVWDMLPSDERECRRPFTCSAVERWHG